MSGCWRFGRVCSAGRFGLLERLQYGMPIAVPKKRPGKAAAEAYEAETGTVVQAIPLPFEAFDSK